jgi:hypothetical protein
MKKLLVLAALLLGLVVGGGPVAAAPPRDPNPPTPAPPHDPFTECGDFNIDVVVTGKIKFIEKPAGRLFITSPGQGVTLTNSKTGKTVSYVVTGVSRLDFLSDRVEVVSTGRNVLNIPVGPRKGVYLTVGNVNFAITLDFTAEVRPFSGPGQVTNICNVLR